MPTVPAPPVLTLDGVGKVFAGLPGQPEPVEAIRRIDGRIGEGEFLVLLGPSGCGKSTLLEIVGGLQRPTSGAVYLRGTRIDAPHPAMGIVFQEESLFPWRTVLENTEFGLEVRGVPVGERRQRCRAIVDLVGLGGFADHYPRQLSGGMRQRVAVGRALALDPEVLLMDEPFGALDQQTRYALGMELLGIWAATGKSILFVTHDISEAVLLGDRVWVLSRRPATVRLETVVDIPRPRSHDTLALPRFHELTDLLWRTLSEESRKAMGS